MYSILKKFKFALGALVLGSLAGHFFFKEVKHELSQGAPLSIEKAYADVPHYSGDDDDDDGDDDDG